ncbi:hypothetical protein [Aerobium aerolatum]|uniref:Uncharacterized protein n=1 Tax=Aquamicrobium aerolatum DSM 21857 TaxID=1121003 RepID=A0A1I3IRX9_9HYPH|nr:hypothetical protein [Aquamicrobium aerolatum]SFI50533.1 hypothetical protein SAMN03080618_00620 [Aquamicrobium aerolatum DSM 21857]
MRGLLMAYLASGLFGGVSQMPAEADAARARSTKTMAKTTTTKTV